MRTLYLNGERRITVRGDGPSLLIHERQRAGRRVPLRLIGQVIIRGNVTLESNVITLLAAHGVPVSFLTGRGEVTATALPLDADSILIRERVERLSMSAKGTARVMDWLRAGRMNGEYDLVQEFFPSHIRAICRNGLREEDYREIREELLLSIDSKGMIDVVSRVIGGLFHELMLKRICDLGLDPHRGFLCRHQNFAFAKDLCYVLGAERDRQLLQFFRGRRVGNLLEMERGRWVVNGEGMKNIVVRFENHKKRVLELVDVLLSDFFDILREAWL